MRELDRGYPTGGKEAGEDAAKKKKTFPMPEHVGGRTRGGCTDGCTDARQLPGGAVGAGGALPGAASICHASPPTGSGVGNIAVGGGASVTATTVAASAAAAATTAAATAAAEEEAPLSGSVTLQLPWNPSVGPSATEVAAAKARRDEARKQAGHRLQEQARLRRVKKLEVLEARLVRVETTEKVASICYPKVDGSGTTRAAARSKLKSACTQLRLA